MGVLENYQRKVLLVDEDPTRQHFRALALRGHEIEVQSTTCTHEARLWCSYGLYDLVLLAAREESETAKSFCEEIQRLRPKQRVALGGAAAIPKRFQARRA